MKKIVASLLALTTLVLCLQSQPRMEVEGSIKVGNNTDANPEPGTMQWTGSDFEVWNGLTWASLTGNKIVGAVSDIDANIYRTIRIGDQIWMAENLRTMKYRNGEAILKVESLEEWNNVGSVGAYCLYNNQEINFHKYGVIYKGYTKLDERGVCPVDWHIPSDDEWNELRSYLQSNAGNKMKAVIGMPWVSNDELATNESGFSAFPGGYRGTSSIGEDFEDENSSTFFWSMSFDRFYTLNVSRSTLGASSVGNGIGCYIRCVKD